jgi:hypothetical protein
MTQETSQENTNEASEQAGEAVTPAGEMMHRIGARQAELVTSYFDLLDELREQRG